MSNAIPGWIDAWLFGVTYVGPITAFLQLTQATRQSVQVDTINGAFQVNFPSGMLINDVIELVDVGNNIGSAHLTISSVNSGYPMQSPVTNAIGITSYVWGSVEASGSSIKFQLVSDPNLGLYLKRVADTATATGGGGTSPPGALITGNTNAVASGNTVTVADASTAAVICQIQNGATDGEVKKFKIGKGYLNSSGQTVSHGFTIQAVGSGTLVLGQNSGAAETSALLNGVGDELVITWVGSLGSWLG